MIWNLKKYEQLIRRTTKVYLETEYNQFDNNVTTITIDNGSNRKKFVS